eukprot:TRINITY_DN32259_c0_g1_i2.p1 TRINITY_DN32259_c0_g1~~TRINITY_DN32259_c0_g1_i2.p1  ORF type:complete len:190 (+),score=46.26 TRINITY_DN32259_c0_g1_i2:76-645(+)
MAGVMVADQREEVPTTYMIQNLPSRWSTESVQKVIDEVGFEGAYDFFYMPRRQRYGKSQSYGYAFINIPNLTTARAFTAAADNGCLVFAARIVKVVPASVQGIDALKAHFRGKDVMVRPVKPMFEDAVNIERQTSSHTDAPLSSTTLSQTVSETAAACTTSPPTTGGGVKRVRVASLRWCDIEDECDDC